MQKASADFLSIAHMPSSSIKTRAVRCPRRFVSLELFLRCSLMKLALGPSVVTIYRVPRGCGSLALNPDRLIGTTASHFLLLLLLDPLKDNYFSYQPQAWVMMEEVSPLDESW